MPYGDGTGPNGAGPRTGRGLGNCPPSGDSKRKTNRPRRRMARRRRNRGTDWDYSRGEFV